MDTKQAAKEIGTEARILRRFLRDPKSTYTTVGSGSRYTFGEDDLQELSRAFKAWQCTKPSITRGPRVDPDAKQRVIDEEVWAEEAELRTRRGLPAGIILCDLRNREVLARVRRIAQAREDRLNERLMAAGLHISQMNRRAS